jgi:hypothetical protein
MIHHNDLLWSAALICALGATLAVPGLATAQPPMPWRGPMAFGAIDLNRDGVVSAKEFAAHRTQRQGVRAAEGRLLRNAGQAPRFESWDTDGNGLLTRQELASGQQARFATRGPGMGPGPGPGFYTGPGRPCWRNL